MKIGSDLTIPDLNTRFTRPIVCPTTGEHVSAETLYNRCCADLGYVVRDHIGDLVLDNLSYSGQPMGEVDTEEMCNAIYAWAASVREQIGRVSQQATGRFSDVTFGRDDSYPWRVVVRGMKPDGDWLTIEVFEWSNEAGAHVVGSDSAAGYVGAFEAVHYYVGEVAR